MKQRLWIGLLIFAIASSSLPAVSRSDDTASRIAALRSTADFTLKPTLDMYERLCAQAPTPPAVTSLKGICEVVVNHPSCAGIDDTEKLRCDGIEERGQIDLWEFLAGCAPGIFESASELLAFSWDLLKSIVSRDGEPSNPEEASYLTSARLYLHSEFDEAYSSQSPPFRAVKALSQMGGAISSYVVTLVSQLVAERFEAFGCLSFEAKSKRICKLMGDIVIPPAAFFALMKYGVKAFKLYPRLEGAFQSVAKASTALAKPAANGVASKAYARLAHLFGTDDVAKLSKANVQRWRSSLGPLSPDEAAILEKVRSIGSSFVHRLDVRRLEQVANDKAVTALESSGSPQILRAVTRTPKSEIDLYEADRYVFGWVGFWKATDKYGDAVVHVKPEHWKQNSWATRSSGYENFMDAEKNLTGKTLTERDLTYGRYDAASSELKAEALAQMKEQFVLPEDYEDANGVNFLRLAREQKLDVARLARLGRDEFRREAEKLIRDRYVNGKEKVGFMEGKIEGKIPLDRIEKIEIPETPAYAGVRRRLESMGVKVEAPPADGP